MQTNIMSIGQWIDSLDGVERALIIAILWITTISIILIAEFNRPRK